MFVCEEVEANIGKEGSRVKLLGSIDGRVNFEGSLEDNSLSKLNVLKYISDTLAKKNREVINPDYIKMLDFITTEISQIVVTNKDAGTLIKNSSEIYAQDISWKRVGKPQKKEHRTKPRGPKLIMSSNLSKSELSKLPYGAVSGFINLEIQKVDETYDQGLWEREGIEFISVKLNPKKGVVASIDLRLGENIRKESLFFFHVLNKENNQWVDVEGLRESSIESDVTTISLRDDGGFKKGKLPFSFYVQGRYEKKKIWLTAPGELYEGRVAYGPKQKNIKLSLGKDRVVIVSPEGPHAIAGGLAQVVKGLSMSLSGCGKDVTLITPLYEKSYGVGSHSKSSILSEGIEYLGKNIKLKEVGEVFVAFGELNNATGDNVECGKRYRVRVYNGQEGRVNFIFLSHPKLADRLYGGISSRDYLERAVFLSRGALEVLLQAEKSEIGGVVLSNDWPSALFEPFKNYDYRYQALKEYKVIHVLHNAGLGYQGRIAVVEDGVDNFGLLNLRPEFIDKFLEDQNSSLINISQASIRSSRGAILTVSKPYAEQILSEDDAEGLSGVLESKNVYGISNGISEKLVRETAFGVGADMSVDAVSDLKKKLLKEVQEELGLKENAEAIFAVMIGRLTEQKGIGLLSPLNNERSVFEVLLRAHKNLQIAVIGPGSEKELEFSKFHEHLNYLKEKYKGRISSKFQFVDPSRAIKYTASASLFLMPSRYEPGGLTQLEALCVGTSVVAHRVGGLSATLSQYTEQSGNSFLFEDFSRQAFLRAFKEAVRSMSFAGVRREVLKRALSAENDWSSRLPYYLALFESLGDLSQVEHSCEELLEKISACKY